MSDLSPKELELLSVLRKEWGPSEETKDAVRAALPRALQTTPEIGPDGDAPPGPSPDRAPPARAPSGGNGMSRGAWAGAGLAALGLCAIGLVWLRSSAPASAPPPQREVPVASTVTTTPATRAAEGATPRAAQTDAVSLDTLPDAPAEAPSGRGAPGQAARAAQAAQPATAPAPGGDTLAEELALLRTAQRALRAGAPNDALAALSTHATRFPRGVLREERMTLQVLALCDRGDVAAARAAKAELEKLSPGSSHLQRLSTSCAAR